MKRLSIIIILCLGLGALFVFQRRDRGAMLKDEAAVTPKSRSEDVVPMPIASVVPEIAVVRVVGDVRSPGTFQLAKPSLVEALTRSVPTPLANLQKVTVLRRGSSSRATKIVVDAAAIMKGEAPDFTLETGDSIFVPQIIL